MDNHPIPQDVTGFQFKLIGEMTVKQFAYLAAGSILAWVFLSLPLFALIKFPLVALFFLLGFLLAFAPLEGRPMDVIFSYFLKALFTPNQYVYQKAGGQLIPLLPSISPQQTAKGVGPLPKEKLQTFLKTLPKSASWRTKNKLDEKEAIFFESIFSLFPHVSSQTQPQNTSTRIITLEEEQEGVPQRESEDEKKRKEILEKEARLLKKELEAAKAQEEEKQQAPTIASSAHEKVLELEKQLNEVLAQRQQLEQQILSLQKKLSSQKQPPQAQNLNVRKIPKEMEVKVGVPIVPDDIPNLITGVVKDSRGNALPNILVEVKDKEGSPARAFKTNGLGQFASATPLLNGTYEVALEDPKGEHKFDAIGLSANGGVLMPLEIRSTDAREELRKSLFS